MNQGKKSEDDDEDEDDPPSSNFGAAREDCPETLNYETNHYCPVKDEVKMISVNIYGPINSFGDVSDLEFNL